MYVKCNKGCLEPETVGMQAQKQPTFKESVTAHLLRFEAPKMDGAKHTTDTPEALEREFWQAGVLSAQKFFLKEEWSGKY